MKKLNRPVVFVLLCCMLVSISLPVSADVIVEPWEDDFYNEHKDECVYNNNRTYVVNTDKGYAYLYASPESNISLKGYSNGEKVFISWLYTDASGEVWGVHSSASGWFRMSELTVVYDGYSFIEEYGHKFQEYIDGSYSIVADEDGPVEIWKYPGKKLEYSYFYGDICEYVSQTYTDEEGTVWGYISYLEGYRNVWICLSGNGGGAIGSDFVDREHVSGEAPTVLVNGEVIELKTEPMPRDKIPMNDGNSKTLIIVGALIAGVVIITAIGIILLGKRRLGKDISLSSNGE